MASLCSVLRATTRKGILTSRPIQHLVKEPHSYFSARGLFDYKKDIDGDDLPIPNSAPLNTAKHREDPPNAAWYTVNNNPTWTSEKPMPLLWDTRSKKSLKEHKGLLMNACNRPEPTIWPSAATDWEKNLIMAIAMQETEYMWGRDDKKDPPQWQGEPDAKNVWCLNLNLDMLKKVGYSPNGNGNDLIDPNDLPKIVGYLLKWFNGKAEVGGQSQQTPYIRSTLNYIRFGRTGYDKADSKPDWRVGQICRDYRSAINSICKKLEVPGRLWNDDERIGIDVPWV